MSRWRRIALAIVTFAIVVALEYLIRPLIR